MTGAFLLRNYFLSVKPLKNAANSCKYLCVFNYNPILTPTIKLKPAIG